MSLRRAIFVACQSCLFLSLLFLPTSLKAEDVWDSPAFSVAPEALRQAASSIKAAKDMDVTVLLNEQRLSFDAQGKEVEIRHTIYRIENEEGVKGWAETSGDWEPWRQAKPEIKVRVITSDGSVHVLDPKTLNDVPVHENDPEIYSDRRAYGGPLPAIAVGAIVEEEVTTRDTAPYFAGGGVERLVLSMDVPVAKSRIVLAHADTLPLHYVLHLLPDATVKKSSENGQETITIENGPLPPYTERLTYLPADAVPHPEVEFARERHGNELRRTTRTWSTTRCVWRMCKRGAGQPTEPERELQHHAHAGMRLCPDGKAGPGPRAASQGHGSRLPRRA